MHSVPGTAGLKGGRDKARRALIVAGVFLFFLISGYLGYRAVAVRGLATLVELQGQPERDTANELGKWRTAQEGDEFYGGDGARTEEKEEATFRLASGARLTLRPSSIVRFQTKKEKASLGIVVEVGEADIKTREGALTVDSEFGPILIQANTNVSMRRQGQRLEVQVEVGSVQLGTEGQRVKAGEAIEVELGGIVVDDTTASGEFDKEQDRDEPPQEEDELELERGNGIDFADLVVKPGESFTVHDPKPPTAVGMTLGGVCGKGPARLVVGTARTEALGQANLALPQGKYEYTVTCLDKPDKIAAQGRIHILRDAGTKALPTFTPSAQVSTDGRVYTVLYQQRLPQVTVTWQSAPQSAKYSLVVDGRTISLSAPSHTFASGSLAAGQHKLTFSAETDPPRQSRTTTVSIIYDVQAPAALVAIPEAGYVGGGAVQVAGQALPGWTVSVDGRELEVDSQRRFSSEVIPKDSLPITFSHPTHGTHYYLRRSKTSSP